VIVLLAVQAAFAAQVSLRVAADQLREGQTVGLEVLVVDAVPKGVPELNVPAGLQVEYRGQTRQRQIINFQPTSSTTFSYSLTMVSPGEHVLPPVAVSTDAGVVTSAPLPLRVEPREVSAGDALEAKLSSTVAWVGQVLVYNLRFQTNERVINGRWSPPDAPGFMPEPTVEPQTAEFNIEQDGKPLSVMQLAYPVRASSPGSWTIPAGVLQAQFAVAADPRKRRRVDSFIDGLGALGNVRTEVYSAKPIPVEVRELPAEGRPPDASGLVGRFAVTARPSATEARVGDTITLEVELSGDGPLAGYTLPPLSGDSFRVYDDQPVVDARVEDGAYIARAAYKRAIVPQQPGTLELPPIEIAYFDPGTASWSRARSEPIRLEVTGESEQIALEPFGGAGPARSVDALGEDILPIRTDPSLQPPWQTGAAAALVVPGALALMVQGGAALRRRRVRVAKEERPGFDALPADPEARLARLEEIFRTAVAEKVGVAPAALCRDDLSRLGPAAPAAEQLYRALEQARYGGTTRVPEAELRAFVEGL
jgi:hypothetical protein